MCDVCENGKPIYYNNDKVLKFEVSINKNNLIVDFPNLYHVVADINHCPNCGRFLGENKPLTLEDIKEMFGKPIWIASPCKYVPTGWKVLFDICENEKSIRFNSPMPVTLYFDDYGKTWTAFRYEVTE